MDTSELEKRMMDRAKLAEIRVTPESWFNHWHTHSDWAGYGNSTPEARRKSVAALIEKLRAVLIEATSYPGDLQSYACIFPDSSNDLVALHSENGSGNYPFDFDEVEWDVPIPELFEGMINLSKARVGRSITDEGPVYWLVPYRREI